MHVLALDQSTSATKALLFTKDGRLVDREARDHKQHYPQAGWVEHDVEEIWQNTLATLRAVLSRLGDHGLSLSDVACLSVTNQRETIVIFDRATGKPLHHALVWQDRRGDAICAAHIGAGHETLVREKTGLKIDGYFSGSKLQWLVRNQPALAAKLLAGSALIGTIDTYLLYRLTQGRIFATDSTNASRTLLFDLTTLRWDEQLCALWEVPMKALPEVRDSTARFGETNLDNSLAVALPIVGVIGDSQAALFAQRCYQPGSAKVTFGTGSSILLNIGAQPRFSDRGVVTTLAWVHGGVPTYAFEGIIISSASTMTWLRDQLGIIRDMSEVEQCARELPDNGGVYLVPAFSGLGLPHWQPAARATITGLTSHSDRRHFIRAGLESISYQIRDALDAMRADAGVPLAGLHGDGGATANAFLMQFTADLAGAELRVATMSDCSPLGAALAGLLGLGLFQSLDDIAKAPRDEISYVPALSPTLSAAYYKGWQDAVRQVLSVIP